MTPEKAGKPVSTNSYGVVFEQVFDEDWIYYITCRDYRIPLAYRDDAPSLDAVVAEAERALMAYLLGDYEAGIDPPTPALEGMLWDRLYELEEVRAAARTTGMTETSNGSAAESPSSKESIPWQMGFNEITPNFDA